MKMAIIVLLFPLVAAATEPNFVRTTTYSVGYSADNTTIPKDMVTTDYSDGLGRSIQSKLSLSSTKDRVSCIFYDDAGRQKYVTKPFVDNAAASVGFYLEGDSSTINATGGALQSQYSNLYAFSSVDYYDDPLNRVKESGVPGADTRVGQDYTDNSVWNYGTSRIWSFGVNLDNSTVRDDIAGYIFYFSNGFITNYTPDFTANAFCVVLDLLYEKFSTANPFTSPQYFLTVTKNPDGHFSQELKDIFGKTLATRSTATSIWTDSVVAHYSYDILGNILAETAPTKDGTKLISDTKYEYNTLGQLIKKKTPDAGVMVYDYYDDGQVKTVTTQDPTEVTTYRTLTYTYDDLGRLAQITCSQANIANKTVLVNYYDDLSQFNYDKIIDIPALYRSGTDTSNLAGKLVASVAYNVGTNMNEPVVDLFSYDDEGKIYKKYKKIPGVQLQEITYTYDLQGKVITEDFLYNNDQITKAYSYDELGRLKSFSHANNSNKELVNYTYNDIGQLTSKTLPPISSDYTQTYSYSIRDQLLNINPPSGKKGFYENIPSYSYAGNINHAQYKYIGASTADFNMTYTYDYLNRLTAVTPSSSTPSGFSASYSYDPAGRILSKTEGASAITNYQYYNNASDQYTSRLQNVKKNNTVVKDYIYDIFGNLVVDFTKNMVIEYDWRNLPVAFRFYSNLSYVSTGTTSSIGTKSDALASNIKNNGNLVSQVVMYYDASGNRVAKLESK